MKFCRHCGAQMQDEAKICLNCGISETTPVSGDTAYCSNCGEKMNAQAAVCVKCGVEQKKAKDNSKSGKITRSRDGKVLAGVCSGLGKAKNVSPWLFRLLFLAILPFGGISLIAYIICAIAIPKEPKDE